MTNGNYRSTGPGRVTVAGFKNILLRGSAAMLMTALLCFCSSDKAGDDTESAAAKLSGKWTAVRVDGAVTTLNYHGDCLDEDFVAGDEESLSESCRISILNTSSYVVEGGDTVYFRISPTDSILYLYNDRTDFIKDVPLEIYQR